jgi:hypothetical protein
MKEKHLKILAGVFLFLLIVYIISKPRPTSVNLDDFVQNIIIGVSKEDIKKIEVYKETTSEKPARMEFAMIDEKWKIPTHYYANVQKDRLNRLLDDLLEMTGKVRTSDPKHLDKFQITDEQGIHLLLKDETDKTLVNLIIGEQGEDPSSNFVRFAGKDKVYFADKNLLSCLMVYNNKIDTLTKFKQRSFVELQAVKQDINELEMIGIVANGIERIVKKVEREVEVQENDSTTTTKKESVWILAKKNKEMELDQDEIEQFFENVTQIRGTELVDHLGNTFEDMNKNRKYGFKRPSHYIVFKKPESEQQNIIFGKKYGEDDGHYMNVQYDALVYKVTKSNYKKIFAWIDELPKHVVD